ncbi:MAG: hypothetical protein ABSA39_08535 [Edaphobacter sp.]
MKRIFVSVVMVALFSAPAFAAKNSQTVDVPSTLRAGSTMLVPGNYNVTWTGSGPDVQVTFAQGKKVVVILPAKLIEQSNRNEELDTDSQNGVEVLQAIRTRTMTLMFSNPPSSGN